MNPMHTIRFETDCPGDTIHLHDEMELLYTLQGRCAVFADGKNFVLGKEDFAVFNPFSSHQLYREEGAHTLSLYIPIQLLNQAEIGTIYCISPLQPEKQASLALLRVRLAELFRDYIENADSRRLNLFAELLELLSILQQDFPRFFRQETSTSEPRKIRNTVRTFFVISGNITRNPFFKKHCCTFLPFRRSLFPAFSGTDRQIFFRLPAQCTPLPCPETAAFR